VGRLSPEHASPTSRAPDYDDEPRVGYAKYTHLRANVRRRRLAYKLFIVVALLTLVLAVVDILYLDSALQYGVYAILGILFLWGIFMLFSRKRGEEELEAMQRMERTLLQCPDCKAVFQYGQIHFSDHKEGVFSCPVCGVYSRLPKPDAQPVKALAPEGNLKEFGYTCRNCGEEFRVGTYGETPIHAVRFRLCPNCGEKNYVERIPLEGQAGPVEGPPVELPPREDEHAGRY
jgi:DNA-directed RNA polymerase subunit RPC12/RpoP